jgi:periplasmic protein TonB
MQLRIDSFKTAIIISLIFHASFFVATSLKLFRKEIDLKDYRIVQLVDFNDARPRQQGTVKQSSRPRMPEAKQTIETSPTPKQERSQSPAPEQANEDENSGGEGGFSSYMPVFKVAQLPEFIIKISPVYPREAKMKGIETEVIVEVYIDTSGKPRKAVVVKSGGKDFDAATIEAIYKSTFSPAIALDGKAVPVRVRIPFAFELE